MGFVSRSSLWRVALSALLPIVFVGCASLKEQSGFVVKDKSVHAARQEPWHNVTLLGDIRKVYATGIGVVELSDPLPAVWKEEFVDKGRTYTLILANGKQIAKPLERVVERAVVYSADGHFVDLFDAVLNPQASAFLVLVPAEKIRLLAEQHVFILSSDGTWLMTTRGQVLPLQSGQDLMQLPQGFLQEHPSHLSGVGVVHRPHPVFTDLERTFPLHFKVRDVSYSGRPGADIVLGQYTSLETVADRFVSCGSLPVTPGMVALSVGVSLVRNAYIVSQQDCLKR